MLIMTSYLFESLLRLSSTGIDRSKIMYIGARLYEDYFQI